MYEAYVELKWKLKISINYLSSYKLQFVLELFTFKGCFSVKDKQSLKYFLKFSSITKDLARLSFTSELFPIYHMFLIVCLSEDFLHSVTLKWT